MRPVESHAREGIRTPPSEFHFLARLHFSAEELLLYPRRPCRRLRRRPHAKC